MGEVGFDHQFCRRGCWGTACYFAKSAIYSDSYAHLPDTGLKQLLIAIVLTGYSWFCDEPNTELRISPLRSTNHKLGSLIIPELPYDIVNAISRDVQIFMAYDSEKTYSAYLLTYNS